MTSHEPHRASARTAPSERVSAVVVTHNRAHYLEKCIPLLEAQTRPVDQILVVDNASTDATAEVLAGFGDRVSVLTLEENVGGAGGFYRGMREAYERGFDWLWLMDDDTAPTETALERLLEANASANGRPPAIVASKVLWRDGSLHPMNRPWAKVTDRGGVLAAAERNLMAMRAASFVSCLVHRRAIDAYGYPEPGYFIWNDDLEYTARVLRHETGYWVPSSVVYHDTPTPHTTMTDSGT